MNDDSPTHRLSSTKSYGTYTHFSALATTITMTTTGAGAAAADAGVHVALTKRMKMRNRANNEKTVTNV